MAADRSNIIDSILVLFLLLGRLGCQPCPGEPARRFRWLLLCALLSDLASMSKMLEAFLVVPAFGLAYLLGAKARWAARIAHLALAAVVLLAVSLSWAIAVDLTPASQRPWVDSTTRNSEIDLAIGYNGLERLLGRGAVAGPGGGRRPLHTRADSGG